MIQNMYALTAGDPGYSPRHIRHVVAPSAAIAASCYERVFADKIKECAAQYNFFQLLTIEYVNKVAEVWKAPVVNPRRPTFEEQAQAEVEEMVGT